MMTVERASPSAISADWARRRGTLRSESLTSSRSLSPTTDSPAMQATKTATTVAVIVVIGTPRIDCIEVRGYGRGDRRRDDVSPVDPSGARLPHPPVIPSGVSLRTESRDLGNRYQWRDPSAPLASSLQSG